MELQIAGFTVSEEGARLHTCEGIVGIAISSTWNDIPVPRPALSKRLEHGHAEARDQPDLREWATWLWTLA